ncbi:Nitrogen permease reactivator protein [Xanthoria parietina]
MALNSSPGNATQGASSKDLESQEPPSSSLAAGALETPQPEQAVRFASVNQEIEPAQTLLSSTTQDSAQSRPQNPLSPEAQAELRSISLGLHSSQLQQRRMSNFAFEPVSLPVSRAPSNEASPFTSRQQTDSSNDSPVVTPGDGGASPAPLAPAEAYADVEPRHPSAVSGPPLAKVHQGPPMPPQQAGSAAESSQENLTEPNTLPTSPPTTRPSSASDHTSTRPTTISGGSSLANAFAKQAPGSREASPIRFPGSSSGTATPPSGYARPFTPKASDDDPYARNKRRPQSKNLDYLDARFVFEGREGRRKSGPSSGSSTPTLPRSGSGADVRNQDKRQSTFSLHGAGGKKDATGNRQDETAAAMGGKHHHGSMSDLKRFLGLGHIKDKAKRAQSPAKFGKRSTKNTSSPPSPYQAPAAHVPFADDHGMATKYGKFGKVLGSGAGGSVRLMKRSSDGVTFAVKQFRDRHSYESEREYNKKVTAEFCIGSTLHHGNIIETLDIVHERGHWYEVMEYAPYDLFAIVMTGKMTRNEINCSFLQIVNGVVYLHSMGLAHRDLKLDNVVVNEHGIMKLIDFGSATVFRYPFETEIVLSSGIVGSDPYLAPEVYDAGKYDPQPADIWSLAIVFACMTLRRFPWKAPRLTDNSFKLFCSAPSPGTPMADAAASAKSGNELTPAVEESRRSSAPPTDPNPSSEQSSEHHHRHHHRQRSGKSEDAMSVAENQARNSSKSEVVKGPWRLLRLLPRETRTIIGRMLETDPKRRATLEDMFADSWIRTTPICRQVEAGQVVRAEGHEHTLEPGTAVQPAEG